MDVEVDDRDPLEAAHVERVARRHGDVVEEAEAHRLVARRVMAGRANGAKGVRDGAVDDRVGRRDGGAGSAHDRGPGAGRGDGVGIDRAALAGGADPLEQVAQLADEAALVGEREVAHGDRRRLALLERRDQPGGDEVVLDGVEALRAFRVAGAHVVAAAIGMAVIRGRHRSNRTQDFLVMSGR